MTRPPNNVTPIADKPRLARMQAAALAADMDLHNLALHVRQTIATLELRMGSATRDEILAVQDEVYEMPPAVDHLWKAVQAADADGVV